MRRWLQRLLQSSVLALGMMLSVPALASPSSDAGCASFEKTSGQTVSACVGSYNNPGSLTPAIFHPNDTSNQSNQPVWTFGSTPVTSSQVVFNALQTFGQSACAKTSAQGQLAPVSYSGTGSATKSVYCWQAQHPSHYPVFLFPTPGSGEVPGREPIDVPEFAFGIQRVLNNIDNFFRPQAIEICSTVPPANRPYVTEPIDITKDCNSVSSTEWECQGISLTQANPRLQSTSKNAKQLAKSMTEHGMPDPGKGCEPHHIVPPRLKGRNATAADNYETSRQILEKCGIGLNSYLNGIWLNTSDARDERCPGFNHKRIHSDKYAKYIREQLSSGDKENGCSGVNKALDDIAKHIREGSGKFKLPGE